MILLIAAMQSEIDAITNNLTLKGTYPFKVYEGVYQNKNVLLIISGIGKTNASSALSYMLTLHPKIKQIINIGIVGGHKVDLYDAYIVSEATYHDVDLTMFNYEYGQIPKYPTLYLTDTVLLKKLHNFKHTRLYTGDIFSTKPIHQNPYIVDMEGASLYQVAHNFKYPILSVKVVSDVIGMPNQLKSYAKSEEKLAQDLSKVLNKVLEVLT